nr:glycosyl hydrolase family 18 protein [Cohnella pontilimi]
MTTAMTPAPRYRRRRSGRWIGVLLLFIVSALATAWWAWNLPNSQHISPEYRSVQHPIMTDGKWTQAQALGEGDGLQIPLDVGQKLMGDGILYEKSSDSIILTTESRVLHFKIGELDGTMNRKPFNLQFAAQSKDGTLYLPLAPLEQLFGIQAETDPSTGIVTLLMPDQAIQRAEIPKDSKKGAKLRQGPDKHEPIVADLAPGTALRLWGESEGWYRAQSASGDIGYVSPKDAVLLTVEKVPSAATEKSEPFVAWKAVGQRINLTWEAVYDVNPKPANIGKLAGVNVVSPTWFELVDGKGNIRSKADASYSQWYRDKGVQVWGLFGNGFEPERTHLALASYESRQRMIQQMLAYAKTFRLQGINLDFENVKTEDKDELVQFVRELTPLAHEQNLVVSIDVTPKSGSEYWSAFLDRARLGQSVDFMMLMAYDEHWATSPTAGSVSSLGWTEESVTRILEEDGVPARKLILGMPLYTRIWTEKPDGKGGVKVSSKTMSMPAVRDLLAKKKLTPTLSAEDGQHYVEFQDGDTTQKIWIEDERSLQARIELAKKYELAGVATWSRYFASPDIWEVMDHTLQSRP